MTNITIKEVQQTTHQFHNEEADLFIFKNERTTSLLNSKGFDTDNLEIVVDAMEDAYYIIPNGYKKEWEFERTPFEHINFIRINDLSLPNDLSANDFEYLQQRLYKIFRTDSFAFTSTSSYAAFWYVEESKMNQIVQNEGKTLRAVTLVEDDIIAIFEDENENDFAFKVVAF